MTRIYQHFGRLKNHLAEGVAFEKFKNQLGEIGGNKVPLEEEEVDRGSPHLSPPSRTYPYSVPFPKRTKTQTLTLTFSVTMLIWV